MTTSCWSLMKGLRTIFVRVIDVGPVASMVVVNAIETGATATVPTSTASERISIRIAFIARWRRRRRSNLRNAFHIEARSNPDHSEDDTRQYACACERCHHYSELRQRAQAGSGSLFGGSLVCVPICHSGFIHVAT